MSDQVDGLQRALAQMTASAQGLAARVHELEAALRGLTDIYGCIWDRVDGALVLFPDRIPQFEAAHEAALLVLAPQGSQS
jgi:hypothetical protein